MKPSISTNDLCYGMIFYLLLLFTVNPVFTQEKINPTVEDLFRTQNRVLVWIFLKDKGNEDEAREQITARIPVYTLKRRAKVMPADRLIDWYDYPVASSYLLELESAGIGIKQKSKWFNAVSAWISKDQIETLKNLSWVIRVEPVMRMKRRFYDLEWPKDSEIQKVRERQTEDLNYGSSFTQNNQINVPAVHNLGIYGQGVRIAVFDNGFRLPNHQAFDSMTIVATYDFVDHKVSVVPNNPNPSFGSHGVNTLSTIGGYKPGQLIGPAFRAHYLLARTENDSSETPVEEDNWIAAIEWADEYGADIISSSLGYIEMDPGSPYSYTWQWMNGDSCRITRAADMATWRGIVVVNSAGNEGSHPDHNTLVAPADGDSVIAVGAVTSGGTRTSFSSVGPTVDGRIKPDVMAMGSGVVVASATNPTGYTTASGTSFSCPLTAGVCGLILSANPLLTPFQVREALRNTANNAASPNNQYGWGIVNALQAVNYYRAVIDHTPLGDTEDLNGPYLVTATISSAMAIDSVTLVYGLNGTLTHSVPMTASGAQYTAMIPGSGVPTQYQYYIRVRNIQGMLSHHPANAPLSYHTFRAGPDTLRPVITHTPIPKAVIYFLPVPLQAQITDNVVVDTAWVEYTINHVPQSAFGLSHKGSHQYQGFFPFTAQDVQVGDSVYYRILARDGSSNHNVATLPANGNFAFSITADTGYTTVFFDDFSNGLLNWDTVNIGGKFNWLIYNVPYPNDYQLPVTAGGKVLAADADNMGSSSIIRADAVLKNAVDASFDSVRLEFDTDWYHYRSTDSAIVYVSANNGATWQPVWTKIGVSARNQHVTMDVTPYLRGAQQAKIKFRSIQPGWDWWWVVDNVRLSVRGPRILNVLSDENSLPKSLELEPNYPNPFNPSTMIRYYLPAQSRISLVIYNVLGHEVRKLVQGSQNAGIYRVQWDGRDNQGRAVASGVYMIRLKTDYGVRSGKMMLLK